MANRTVDHAQGVKPTRGKRKLKDLVPFPTQDADFPSCSAGDDELLLEDVRQHGVKQPIEILPENEAGFPANTILFGHRRAWAAKEAGYADVPVLVRYDLAEADAVTIEQEFIKDNLVRRQLSGLGKARCIKRLFELERQRKPDELTDQEAREARDRVGQLLGMSGRNAQRYLNLLKAPTIVQEAFDNGKISLVQADRIGRLPADVQQEIGEEICGGKDAKRAIQKRLGAAQQKPRHRATAVNRFIKHLDKALGELNGFDLDGYSGRPASGQLAILAKTNKASVQLFRAMKENSQLGAQILDEANAVRRRKAH